MEMEGLVIFVVAWMFPPAICAWIYDCCKGEDEFMRYFLRGLLYWPLFIIGAIFTIYYWHESPDVACITLTIAISTYCICSKLGKKDK